MQSKTLPDQGLDPVDPDQTRNRLIAGEQLRPVLRALARVIASDRRPVALASHKAEILLANRASQRLGLDSAALAQRFDWPDLTARAKRAGQATLVWQAGGQTFEGELVLVPLGPADGYLLRLSETDQEASLLRNQARAALLMRVAHDLRTPIQSLLAAAPALTAQQGASTAEAERMRRAAGLALDHISSVLAVIRGEQSSAGMQPDEDFRIADELAHLVQMVEPIARARSAEVSLTVEAPQDLTLHGPLRFVRALCQNLIDNSVNHGGGKVQLTLSAQALPHLADEAESAEIWRVRLVLSDEGGGLPAAQKLRLAEALGLPQGTADLPVAAPDRRPSAGLAVMAHALRQLGGQIRIEARGADGNPLPEGSIARVIGTIFTVSFTLPGAPDLRAPASAPPDLALASLTGRSLLLVEDSPAARDWLTHVLQSAGAEVIAVASAPEALALLQREAFATKVDLVLTDVTLPRISGIELTQRLLSGDVAAAQPWFGQVVGLTAHADERIRKAGLAAGMSIVLEKPILPRVLVRQLVDILAGRPYFSADPAQPSRQGPAIDRAIAAALIEQIGLAATLSFMRRALDEAASVQHELAIDGVGPDTARRLHAATGAAGLTGLILVDARLRAAEAAVAAKGPELGQAADDLAQAIGQSHAEIAALGQGSAAVANE